MLQWVCRGLSLSLPLFLHSSLLPECRYRVGCRWKEVVGGTTENAQSRLCSFITPSKLVHLYVGGGIGCTMALGAKALQAVSQNSGINQFTCPFQLHLSCYKNKSRFSFILTLEFLLFNQNNKDEAINAYDDDATILWWCNLCSNFRLTIYFHENPDCLTFNYLFRWNCRLFNV